MSQMKDFDASKAVDMLLEGKALSDIVRNPHVTSLEGKILGGVTCESCGAVNKMIVKEVSSFDQGFYVCIAECEACREPVEIEVVVKGEAQLGVTEGRIDVSDAVIYTSLMEGGIMNGNYLKFNNGVKGFIAADPETKDLTLYFDAEKAPEGAKPLNTRVTFKVISFRNNMAKLISMVNDNANKYAAGTVIMADKNELQKYAKMASPKQNPSMAGKFAY